MKYVLIAAMTFTLCSCAQPGSYSAGPAPVTTPRFQYSDAMDDTRSVSRTEFSNLRHQVDTDRHNTELRSLNPLHQPYLTWD